MAVFAIRAVDDAELMRADGYFSTYRGISASGTEWTTEFLLATCPVEAELGCDRAGQFKVTVADEAGTLVVTRVEGDIPEDHLEPLLKYSESNDGLTAPGFEPLTFVIREAEEAGTYRASGGLLWTGPTPFDGFAECKVVVRSDEGVQERDEPIFYESPQVEGERASAYNMIGFPSDSPPTGVDLRCHTYEILESELSEREDTPPSYGYALTARSFSYGRPLDGNGPFLSPFARHERGAIRVNLSARWLEESFPGIRSCTVLFFDAGGTEVGRFDWGGNTVPEVEWEVDVKVDSLPATVQPVCEEPRLDDPNGRYEVTSVSFDPTSGSLNWSGRWIGSSDIHTINVCTLTFTDADGDVVSTEDFTFSTEGETFTDISVGAEYSPDQVEATDAEIECIPYSTPPPPT